MTIVVATRTHMVADSQATGEYVCSVDKIWRVKGDLLGMSGNVSDFPAFYEFMKNPLDPVWDGYCCPEHVNAMLLTEGGIWLYEPGVRRPYQIKDPWHAIGSAAPIAAGVMSLYPGSSLKTVKRAVQAAINVDPSCGGPIRTLRL